MTQNGAPVEVDISKLTPGELGIYEWRGKPVWVMKRTKEMLEAIKKADDKVSDPKSSVKSQQPSYAANEFRSSTPELMVLVGVCTHLGCSPKPKSPAPWPTLPPPPKRHPPLAPS